MKKFQDMTTTADGSERASVTLNKLKTLWFNTGTLCNLECKNCYIESSPKNDRLVYITADEVKAYLLETNSETTPSIGLTGGEPFLNPHIISILECCLELGHEVLVLTNANRVLKKHQEDLLRLNKTYGDKLKLRISLDHFTKEVHEQERGRNTFDRTIEQTRWLYDHGLDISIASRSLKGESAEEASTGHAQLLERNGINLDIETKLVVFPEMLSGRDLPEITTKCWSILNKSPNDQMCATERMVVKRKGDTTPVVMPCTLLAYDEQFILGNTLKDSERKVYLNHKFCAEFCVLGGASCSSTK
ncbi:MAG: radical SAM protein [Bacteriovoracaceae bacterium]|nr:radical SAM protein [Bacteriovoracaceae bacterium]